MIADGKSLVVSRLIWLLSLSTLFLSVSLTFSLSLFLFIYFSSFLLLFTDDGETLVLEAANTSFERIFL